MDARVPRETEPEYLKLRWALLALVSLAFIINFLDRQVLSVLAPTIGDNVTSMLLMLTTGIVLDRFSYLPVFTMAGILPLIIMANVVCMVGRVKRLI